MLNRPLLWSVSPCYLALVLLALALLALPACDPTGGPSATPTVSPAPTVVLSPTANQPNGLASATPVTTATGDGAVNADKLFHDSRDVQFRNPVGPVVGGTDVVLRLRTQAG